MTIVTTFYRCKQIKSKLTSILYRTKYLFTKLHFNYNPIPPICQEYVFMWEQCKLGFIGVTCFPLRGKCHAEHDDRGLAFACKSKLYRAQSPFRPPSAATQDASPSRRLCRRPGFPRGDSVEAYPHKPQFTESFPNINSSKNRKNIDKYF